MNPPPRPPPIETARSTLAQGAAAATERRRVHQPALIPGSGDRRAGRASLRQPLPAKGRPAQPLPAPSDWTFELIDQYHDVIRQTAERFGLDTYPNQLEIITAEQMMDA